MARNSRESKTVKAKNSKVPLKMSTKARAKAGKGSSEMEAAGKPGRPSIAGVERGLTAFGERLVLTLQSKGMSDSELADALGIAQPNIHTLKYKTDRPRYRTVEKIAKVLGVETQALLPQTMSIGSPAMQDGTKVYLVIESAGGRQTIRLA
ncbi:MAG: helix-turn-helix transcriptional regulator [Bdellovibrionales bacterium]|jgi:transcriptional regulator with XRE-family HTH domain|nr:helix-turn-helix transcriptional regulator [Bdellovibrionales bacterium]